MDAVDISAADAEDALVRLALHVPVGVDIGMPYVAEPGADGAVLIFTRTAAWWSYPDHAARLDERPDGEVEIVEFRHGQPGPRTLLRPRKRPVRRTPAR
jgi:hypothetical protein